MDMSSNYEKKEKTNTKNVDIIEIEMDKNEDNIHSNIDKVHIKFISNKSNTIEKGDIYDFDTANELVRVLNEKSKKFLPNH